MSKFLAGRKGFVKHDLAAPLSARVLTDLVAKKQARQLTYPVTEEWRHDIRARMDELKIKQAELARLVKCSEPTLHHLLRPNGNQKTRLMADIHAALKLPPPGAPKGSAPEEPPPMDPVVAELSNVIARLDDEWKSKLLDIARNFPIKPKG
jgi:hypothetical protein